MMEIFFQVLINLTKLISVSGILNHFVPWTSLIIRWHLWFILSLFLNTWIYISTKEMYYTGILWNENLRCTAISYQITASLTNSKKFINKDRCYSELSASNVTQKYLKFLMVTNSHELLILLPAFIIEGNIRFHLLFSKNKSIILLSS